MVSEKLVRATTLGAAAIFAIALSVTQTMAQDKKGAAAPATKPAAAAAGDQKPADIWYKLCIDVPVPDAPKEGDKTPPAPKKPEDMKKVNVCLTQVDIRDNATAILIGKLAVRVAANEPKPSILAMLPLGSLLPAGALVKIDDKEPIKLVYNTCDQAGCYAEAPVDPSVIEQMKTGKQIAYLGIDVTGRQLAIPLPLEGFAKAFNGPPVAEEKYREDQRKIADVIRTRLADLRKQQEDAAKNAGGAPAAPAGKK